LGYFDAAANLLGGSSGGDGGGGWRKCIYIYTRRERLTKERTGQVAQKPIDPFRYKEIRECTLTKALQLVSL